MSGETRVDVRFRDGRRAYRVEAGFYRLGADWWRWKGSSGYNIIAWRLHVADAPAAPAEPDLLTQAIEALRDSTENGLIYWEPLTGKAEAALTAMLERNRAVLAAYDAKGGA